MKQKQHLNKVRPMKEIDPLLRHLRHESGFYGVFVNDLDNYIYVGFADDILATCRVLLSYSRNPGTRSMAVYMNQFAFTFDKIPVSINQIGINRPFKHLELIHRYKTFPPQFDGHGFNFTNPVTGKTFRDSEF